MEVTLKIRRDDGTAEEHQFPMPEDLGINSLKYVLYVWKLNYIFGQLYRQLPVEEVHLDGQAPVDL